MKRALSRFPVSMIALACVLAPSIAHAEDPPPTDDEKHVSGMSIVGNDESPKSLVIVPWKSSDLGGGLDLSRRFGRDRSALDPEVFRRTLEYHAIRTGQTSR